jgi:hypothetical protein
MDVIQELKFKQRDFNHHVVVRNYFKQNKEILVPMRRVGMQSRRASVTSHYFQLIHF